MANKEQERSRRGLSALARIVSVNKVQVGDQRDQKKMAVRRVLQSP